MRDDGNFAADPKQVNPEPPRQCEKHELTGCADCFPRADSPGRSSDYGPGKGPWFEARLHSQCDGSCGGKILPGDTIRADGEGGYLCSDCGRD